MFRDIKNPTSSDPSKVYGETSCARNENVTSPSTPNSFPWKSINNNKLDLAICNGLTDPMRTISDSEFVEWVESIASVEKEELRKKMSRALFLHIANIFSRKM